MGISIDKAFVLALVPVLGGVRLSGTPVTARGADILEITSCNFWSKQTVRKSK